MEGKIIKALAGFYYVYSEGEIYACKARGKFRKMDIKPLVGDQVTFQIENETEGYVLDIQERRNSLVRPPIANIDQAYIVVSAKEPDFGRTLLNKFLLMVENLNIHPVIIITKMDLVDCKDPIYDIIAEYQKDGYEVYPTSKLDLESLQELKDTFKDKTSVFTGQSGVGKSSLLNALDPEFHIATSDISKALGRGRHTTRHVELFPLFDGFVADSPGFSSLELTMSAKEAAVAYHDYAELSASCRFRGCLHLKEPDCSVKEAVENGTSSKGRYEDYVSFLNEIQNRKEKY